MILELEKLALFIHGALILKFRITTLCPGGLPKVFFKYARKFGFVNKLKNFDGIIVGNSAGAMVLCKKCIITADEDHPRTEVVEGLGLVDFSVTL